MTGIQLENINGKKRFLSLHTLNWNYKNKLTVSFSEASLYTGENRGIEWQFFNPVIVLGAGEGKSFHRHGKWFFVWRFELYPYAYSVIMGRTTD